MECLVRSRHMRARVSLTLVGIEAALRMRVFTANSKLKVELLYDKRELEDDQWLKKILSVRPIHRAHNHET